MDIMYNILASATYVLTIFIIMISCNAYYSDIIVMPSVVASTTSTAVTSVVPIIMTSVTSLVISTAASSLVVSTTATSVISTSVPSVTPSMYASAFCHSVISALNCIVYTHKIYIYSSHTNHG